MPLTFMRYFYIGAGLRQLMMSMKWPDDAIYEEMMQNFRDTFSDGTLGTRVVDALPFRATTGEDIPTLAQDDIAEAPLPRLVYESILELLNSESGEDCYSSAYQGHGQARHTPNALLNPYGQQVTSVTRDKLVFATAEKKGLRNSFVVFKDAVFEGRACAGQISQIYLHSRNRAGITVTEAFLQIKAYEHLTDQDAIKDPYCQWKDLNTHLCYSSFQERTPFVRLGDVIAHFAAYMYTPDDIGKECIVVRSLDRVRNVLVFACAETALVYLLSY